MTQDKLIHAITELDADILDRYFTVKQTLAEKKKPKRTWIKWASLAARFALIVGAIIVVPTLHEGDPSTFYPSVHGSSSDPSIDHPSYEGTPGLYQTSFGFDSYEEMIKAFRKRDLNPNAYTIQELKSVLGEPYTSFVDKVNENRAFPRPILDNKPMTYRNEEGLSNITFFVSELYGLPWIWYFPSVSTGENFYIKITYLPDSMMEKQANPTASEIIKELSPNSPNIGNLGKQHESISNQQIKLYDREITALVIEYKTDNRSSTIFVYDDLLVEVRCDPEVWSDQWFSALSFDNLGE